MQPSQGEAVTIVCTDAYRLSGHFFAALQSLDTPAEGKSAILIAPATGVRQQFYWKFAAWLSAQGHDVLVFDYRGIGLSLQGPLSACKASLADWGQLDQTAAIDWLLERTGQQQIVLVGHSAGGQMIGLLHNHHRIARLVGIATSTGWFKGMRPSFALKAHLGLRILVPIGVRLTGYAPTSKLGLGENLPARVGVQWGQWCAAGGYATHAVKHTPDKDFHAAVTTPIRVLYADDDDIATDATVADLLRTFPAADKRATRLSPAQYELKSLGHLDWFRQSHQAVWPTIAKAVAGGEV